MIFRPISVRRAALASLLAALLPIGAGAAPQEATGSQPDQRSSTTGSTLAASLRALAAAVALDVRLDPKVADVPVLVDLSGVPPELALQRVLVASGVDFVIGQRGHRFVVVAGDAAEARPLVLAPEDGAGASATASQRDEAAERASAAEEQGEQDEQAQAAAVASGDAASSRPAGEVTAAELAALIAAAPKVDRTAPGWVELPFPDEHGQPVRVWRPGGNPGIVELPFPDESGQPLVQQVPARPLGFVELPFPDEHGRPIRVATPPAATPVPATSPVPGVVPGAKPPGDVR